MEKNRKYVVNSYKEFLLQPSSYYIRAWNWNALDLLSLGSVMRYRSN